MQSFIEFVTEGKLPAPGESTKQLSTAELSNVIGKTATKAITSHPFFKKHVGDHELTGHTVVHKVDVDKWGYPTVRSSSTFAYKNKEGKPVRKMVHTMLAGKSKSKVDNMHLYHNIDNEREGSSPVWRHQDSLHKEEE